MRGIDLDMVMERFAGITGLLDLFLRALANVPGILVVALLVMAGVVFAADRPRHAAGILLGGIVLLDLLYWRAT